MSSKYYKYFNGTNAVPHCFPVIVNNNSNIIESSRSRGWGKNEMPYSSLCTNMFMFTFMCVPSCFRLSDVPASSFFFRTIVCWILLDNILSHHICAEIPYGKTHLQSTFIVIVTAVAAAAAVRLAPTIIICVRCARTPFVFLREFFAMAISEMINCFFFFSLLIASHLSGSATTMRCF